MLRLSRNPKSEYMQNPPDYRHDTVLPLPPEVKADAWAVDAGCSGNPGPMEYQCIDLQTGYRVFHFGPIKGTNNIGEFLAIVHALALCWNQGLFDKTIYSDSYNAILWSTSASARQNWSVRPRRNPCIRLLQGPKTGWPLTTSATPSSSGKRPNGGRFPLTLAENKITFWNTN